MAARKQQVTVDEPVLRPPPTRLPLVGPNDAATKALLAFLRFEPTPHIALPEIASVNAEGNHLTVQLSLPPGERLSTSVGPAAVRARWLSDIADLLEFLHGQRPFPIALGRITADSFEIVGSRVYLTDFALDLPAPLRLVEADLGAFRDLVRGVLPEAALDFESLLEERVDSLARTRSFLSFGKTEGRTCACGATSPMSARFCAVCGTTFTQTASDSHPLQVHFSDDTEEAVLASCKEDRIAPLVAVRLSESLEALHTSPGFDRLVCTERLPNLVRMFYQEEAALRVLRTMRGRALLADEVGLGKTIEAGLVLKELLVRGLVESILVVCPQSLASQWQSELFEKFDELLLILGRDIDSTLAWRSGRLIASYASLEQRWHSDELTKQRYDLVILDEAHYLNDPLNERALDAVRRLSKRYFLLLSATPMHNDLGELHNILTLLRPGHVGTKHDFLAAYADPSSDVGARDVESLRRIVQEVMIRNLRSKVAEDYRFPQRIAKQRMLDATPAAVAAYREVQDTLREHAKDGPLRRILLDRGGVGERLTSSRAAFQERIDQLARPLARQGGNELLTRLKALSRDPRLEQLVEPKVQATIDIVRLRIAHSNAANRRKVLAFSQFNATARMLYQRLTNAGLIAFFYDETQDRDTKDRAIADFYRATHSVLVCPGEAEEGLNLQFAQTMINYDLPWDPMRIEQRIGRIQRLGNAASEVEIINLVVNGTVDVEIIELLEKKIRMFEAVVGPVQTILGNLEKGEDPQDWIADIFLDVVTESDDGSSQDPLRRTADAIDRAWERAEDSSAALLTALYEDDYLGA